jgi:hypothetical protein
VLRSRAGTVRPALTIVAAALRVAGSLG